MQDLRGTLCTLREKLKEFDKFPQLKTYLQNDGTLTRFLKARGGDIQKTEKMLRQDLDWRQQIKPDQIDCQVCHRIPGSHSLRQVGFDEAGRPVIYASFYQIQTNMVTHNETLNHLIYTLENAILTMPIGISQWVIVIDCLGMTVGSCNPRLSYECARLVSDHYPERLGLVICIHPGTAFKLAWNAIKPFLPNNTVFKFCLVKQNSKIQSTLEQHLPSELCDWLMTEIKLNKLKPNFIKSRQFWLPPSHTNSNEENSHDPRGEKKFVNDWLKLDNPRGYLPHPNIVDQLKGLLSGVESTHNGDDESSAVNSHETANIDYDDQEEDDEDDEKVSEHLALNLPEELQIPLDATKL